MVSGQSNSSDHKKPKVQFSSRVLIAFYTGRHDLLLGNEDPQFDRRVIAAVLGMQVSDYGSVGWRKELSQRGIAAATDDEARQISDRAARIRLRELMPGLGKFDQIVTTSRDRVAAHWEQASDFWAYLERRATNSIVETADLDRVLGGALHEIDPIRAQEIDKKSGMAAAQCALVAAVRAIQGRTSQRLTQRTVRAVSGCEAPA